jgi:hypothetical protein
MDRRSAFLRLVVSAPLVGGMIAAGHHILMYAVGGDAAFAPMLAEAGQATGGYAGAALLGARTGWWLGLVVSLPAFVMGFNLLNRGSTLFAVGGGVIALGVLMATTGTVLSLAVGLSLPGFSEGRFDSPEGRAALMYLGAAWGALGAIPLGLYAMWKARKLDRKETA